MVHAPVIPADAEKFSIYKTIESNVKLPVAYRTRECDMLSVPESTGFTWRLSVKTSPEKPRCCIVMTRSQQAKLLLLYCYLYCDEWESTGKAAVIVLLYCIVMTGSQQAKLLLLYCYIVLL